MAVGLPADGPMAAGLPADGPTADGLLAADPMAAGLLADGLPDDSASLLHPEPQASLQFHLLPGLRPPFLL